MELAKQRFYHLDNHFVKPNQRNLSRLKLKRRVKGDSRREMRNRGNNASLSKGETMQVDKQEYLVRPYKRHFSIEETVFIVMMILSLLGIVITDFSRHDGYGYWMFMVLVFGALSIFVSWLQAKTHENDIGEIVRIQGLHWLQTLLIVGASSLLSKSADISEVTASLMILLILSLATMLDGMRIGWQFSLVGFYLAACAVFVAHVDAFIWACSALALLVVAGTLLWGYWIRVARILASKIVSKR